MEKPGEENSDGLEIVSIGKIYTGPWEKKYWTSSRVRFHFTTLMSLVTDFRSLSSLSSHNF